MATSQTSRVKDSAPKRSADELVPFTIRVAGAWSWRLIAIGVVLVALSTTFGALTTLAVPLVIALIIASPLGRFVTWMESKRIPRGFGAVIAIVLLVGSFSGLTTAAGVIIANSAGDFRERIEAGIDEVLTWVADGPLNLSRQELREGLDNAIAFAQENAWGLAGGTVSVVGFAGAFVASVIIAIISLFFFLRDGRQMWLWVITLLPGDSTAARVDAAGARGWDTLQRYTGTAVIVAIVDAIGIGLVAWALGVPLALPIAILTFVTAFVPILGATVAGAVAVLIALVDGGWTMALLMLAGVLVVQQVESNVLYPWLFGKASALHPFAILVTISAGTLTLGIVGAVIAVPILAFVVSAVKSLHSADHVSNRSPSDDADGDDPDDQGPESTPQSKGKSSSTAKGTSAKTD